MTSENALTKQWVVIAPEVLSGEALEPYSDGVGSPGFLETVEPHLPGQKKLAVHSGEIWVALFEHTNGSSRAGFFPGDEFVYVLDGTVTLTDDKSGAAPTYIPGEHFLVPKGWQGVWSSEGFYREIAVCSRDWLVPYTRTFAGGIVDSRRRDDVLKIEPGNARARLEEPGTGGWPRAAHLHGSDLLVRLVAGTGSNAVNAALDDADTFVQILEGSVSFSAADGATESFGEGAYVIVPEGSSASWEIAPEFVGIAITAGVRS